MLCLTYDLFTDMHKLMLAPYPTTSASTRLLHALKLMPPHTHSDSLILHNANELCLHVQVSDKQDWAEHRKRQRMNEIIHLCTGNNAILAGQEVRSAAE